MDFSNSESESDTERTEALISRAIEHLDVGSATESSVSSETRPSTFALEQVRDVFSDSDEPELFDLVSSDEPFPSSDEENDKAHGKTFYLFPLCIFFISNSSDCFG